MMKAAWIMLAAGVTLWAGADASLARPHHKKKAAAAASSSSDSTSSSSDTAQAADAPPAQQVIAPQTATAAKPPALVANTPTTTQYNPANGFPDHNGALSAMMVVIPRGELQEFEGPAGAGRHLDRVSRAEPGAELAIKIVFVGVTPDWNNNANVTFDLQVLGPDGKIYGHSDYKGMVALKGRVQGKDQTGMYDNRQVIVMQFEPQDMVGMYKVHAVLHDNVGKLDVPLDAGIELLQRGAVAAVKTPPASAPAAAGASSSTAASSSASPSSSASDVSMSPVADDDTPAPKKKKRRHHN